MNYNNYICSANDRIDLIVNKHYGDLENLNIVIEHNPELFNKSMNLASGTIIKLPIYIIEDKKVLEPTFEDRVPLW
jgi:phage tail protein X